MAAYRYLMDEDGAEMEIWIDAAEKTLLQLDGSDGSDTITMTISEWNTVEPIPAPEDAIPAEELMGS